MAERTPKNRIRTGKYTSGNEYVIASSGVEYTGYYYVKNGIVYAGKDETTYQQPILLELAPINFMADVINTTGFFTDAYNFAISNLETAKTIANKVFPSVTVQQSVSSSMPIKLGIRNYVQRINENIIKEINSDDSTLAKLQKDPTYKVISINFSSTDVEQQITEAEKTIPGIRTFVNL
jgi:hypothetical protein